LLDPIRLRLSVAQALNRYNRERYLYLLNGQIDDIVAGLHEYDRIIAQLLESSVIKHQSSTRTFQVFARTLALDLEYLVENRRLPVRQLSRRQTETDQSASGPAVAGRW
jgi:hypothetical protein